MLLLRIFSQKIEALFRVSCLSLPVNRDKAEGHRISLLPLVVIEQAPMAIAHHVDAVVDALFNSCKGAVNKLASAAVIGRSNAVLSDE